jgi:hypothetical protein
MSSLGMKPDTKIVLTSFFRPNLRFSVSNRPQYLLLNQWLKLHAIIESNLNVVPSSRNMAVYLLFGYDKVVIRNRDYILCK